MARSLNKKSRLLYVMKILLENTDEDHALTCSRIIEKLSEFGIKAERKSIYADIDTLRDFGLDIIKRKTKTFEYFVANREFELPELKLLVDAVQSAKFITCGKSVALIAKLESLCSIYQASELNRQVLVEGQLKAPNESIYYNTDIIHSAILHDKKVKFKYYDWSLNRETAQIEKIFRRDGVYYEISPWALIWDDEYYYMVAYDTEAAQIKHFRVDKMMAADIVEKPRDGNAEMQDFNSAQYAKKTYGMFGGEETEVQLEFSNNLVGVVVDRFGGDVEILKTGEESFQIQVSVAVSPLFYAWLFNFCDAVAVISPEHVKKEYQERAERILRQYRKNCDG